MARRIKSLCALVAAATLLGDGRGAFAQEAPPAPVAKAGTNDPMQEMSEENARRVLTDVLTQRVSIMVQRFVPQNEFLVTVQAKPQMPFLSDIPYMPAAQSTSVLLELPGEELKKQIADVTVEIHIAKRFDKESRDNLAALLRQNLGIESATAIKITDLGVQGAPVDDGLQRQLQKAEADLRQANSDMELIKRERNDAKNELLIKQAMKEKEKEPEAAKAVPGAAPAEAAPKVPTLQDHLIQAAPFLVGGILAFLLLLLCSRMFASAIRSIGAAIGTIAGALASVGGAMKVKAETETSDGETKDDGAQPAAAAPAAAVGGGGGGPGSDLTERVVRLSREILEGLNERTENVLLKSLTMLLARPETVAKGVATLELLGRDKANEFFHRLGKESRTTVQSFLLDGNYGRPKFELMLESGEELKTKLLGEGFGQMRGELTLKLAQELLKLSEDDLFEVATLLPVDQKARLFVYMESKDLTALLTRFEQERADKMDPVIDAIAKIASVEREVSLDDQIVKAITEFLGKKVDDPQKKYMPYYQQIIESLAGDLAEKTVERLGVTDANLKSQLSRFVVTFRTLFKLPVEVRKEILDPFSNKQLAALVYGMDAALRPELMTCIIERRHEQINDEMGFLGEMSAKDSQAAVAAAQDSIVIALKKLRNNGSLQEYLSAAAAAPTSTAAPIKSAA